MSADHQRVLLVHPGIYDSANPFAFPPWGALSIASSLRDAGVETAVADLNGLEIRDAMRSLIAKHRPTIVGFTCKLGLAARRFRDAVECIREVCGLDVKIVAGGPLVSTYPDRCHPLWDSVDALLFGDGESAMLEWLARPGSEAGHAQTDLDKVGWGLWWPELRDYVRPADYWPNMNVAGIHVASARGCTRRCTFCYLNTHGPGRPRFRYMSAARLFEELINTNAHLNVSGFYFVDDCFIDHGGHRLDAFTQVNIRNGSPFRFGCDVQLPDLMNTSRLEKMHEAGFRSLYLGVEAASAEVRKRLGKGTVRESIDSLINRTIDMGFVIRASIGIGWPGERVDEMFETIALIDRIDRLVFDAYKFFPLPGTPLGESTYWASRRALPLTRTAMLEDAYCDYSQFNSNYSGVPDEVFASVWERMRQLEEERLGKYCYGLA